MRNTFPVVVETPNIVSSMDSIVSLIRLVLVHIVLEELDDLAKSSNRCFLLPSPIPESPGVQPQALFHHTHACMRYLSAAPFVCRTRQFISRPVPGSS